MKLESITIYLDDKEQFVGASASWKGTGLVEGWPASVGATGNVAPKPITDAIKAIITQVIADGPPAPPEA